MGFGNAVKGVAEFFNLSNVSRAFESLGGGAADDLARAVHRTQQARSIVGKAVDTMSEEMQQQWDKMDKALRKSGISAQSQMTGMEKAIENLEKSGAFSEALKDETFAKALSEFKSKQGVTNNLEYFGREAKGNLSITQKLNGAVFDPEYGSTRIKTGIAVAGGTVLTTRYLSGGNLTTNARGERDIAGIPIF